MVGGPRLCLYRAMVIFRYFVGQMYESVFGRGSLDPMFSSQWSLVCRLARMRVEYFLSSFLLTLSQTRQFQRQSPRQSPRRSPPHIVILLADDLGWNEVSWNNPSLLTPNLEMMKRDGVHLLQSYVTPKCSPSRAALLTGISVCLNDIWNVSTVPGMYPWRIGLQRGAIERFQPDGLNTSLKLLPEYLQESGYKTHLVGKWHLGYCHPHYLPNNRG